MFEKILIATDFSTASDRLIDCVTELMPFGIKKVVLAHVVYVADSHGIEEMFKEQVPAHLDPQKKRLERQGLEVETALEFGIPARDLNLLAERHDVSAILIGSRGHNLLKSTLGGVSFRLLQNARRPVFLSRIKVSDTKEISVCSQIFSNVLFATDFSNAAERAFGYIEDIAREFSSDITLMHVFRRNYEEIPLSASGVKKRKDLDRLRTEKKKERLEEMKERLEEIGSQVEIVWKTGASPAKEIIARVAGGRFSLVVMGNHGRGFFREVLLGSIANDVVRHVDVPVLLVPSMQATTYGKDFSPRDRTPPNWPKEGISHP